jgi:hypothetical protein
MRGPPARDKRVGPWHASRVRAGRTGSTRAALIAALVLSATPALAQLEPGAPRPFDPPELSTASASVAPALGGGSTGGVPGAGSTPLAPPTGPSGQRSLGLLTRASTTASAVGGVDGRDPKWLRYHAAHLRLVDGDTEAAKAGFEALAREHPDHAAGRAAAEIGRALASGSLGWRIAAVDDAFSAETPTALARAELVVGQTLHGIALGGEFCGVVQCDDGRAIVAALVVGAGVGLTGSLLLTGDGVTAGRASALNTGTIWGGWNGLALLGSVAPSDFGQEAFAVMMASQLVGLGAGELAYRLWTPTGGDVAMANSAGAWLGAFTLFGLAATSFDADSRAIFATLLVASDLGLVGGALATSWVRMSRGRVLLIDTGGLLGTLLGFGVTVLAAGDNVEPSAVFPAGIIGGLAGLGLTAYLTRNWDLPDTAPQAHLMLAPTEGGMTVGLGGRF